jgi:hypothetical protein
MYQYVSYKRRYRTNSIHMTSSVSRRLSILCINFNFWSRWSLPWHWSHSYTWVLTFNSHVTMALITQLHMSVDILLTCYHGTDHTVTHECWHSTHMLPWHWSHSYTNVSVDILLTCYHGTDHTITRTWVLAFYSHVESHGLLSSEGTFHTRTNHRHPYGNKLCPSTCQSIFSFTAMRQSLYNSYQRQKNYRSL